MNKRFITLVSVSALFILIAVIVINSLIVKLSFRRLEKNPDSIKTIYEYGLFLYSQKDYKRGARAFEIIASQKKDPLKREEALFKLAEIYENDNRLLEAKGCYQRLIKDFPDSKFISTAQANLENINLKILFSPIITEDSLRYEIKSNDTLGKIAQKFNTTVELLKKSNGLKNDIIVPGRFLKVTKAKFSILVDKSQNRLSLKANGEIIKTYTVSTGSNNSTPVGKFKIEEKLISPPWYKIGAVVEPNSSEYELGKYWMGISMRGYGIHGTKDPNTIGKQITKGCVRLLDEDVEELFAIVPSGTEVVIVD